jgi:hypothetical protein
MADTMLGLSLIVTLSLGIENNRIRETKGLKRVYSIAATMCHKMHMGFPGSAFLFVLLSVFICSSSFP